MSKNDGGTAFPVREDYCESQGHYRQYASDGMTLRDYFAAKASDDDIGEIMGSHFDYDSDVYTITRQQARYMHADAMLAERAK